MDLLLQLHVPCDLFILSVPVPVGLCVAITLEIDLGLLLYLRINTHSTKYIFGRDWHLPCDHTVSNVCSYSAHHRHETETKYTFSVVLLKNASSVSEINKKIRLWSSQCAVKT